MSKLGNDNTRDRQNILPLNLEQATNLVIERAKALVYELIESRTHDRPPFLPGEFAPLLGIGDIEEADLGNTSALLLRFNNGYRIKVNQNHPIVRRNFSCAHEIGHILLGELEIEHYIQNIEYRTYDPQGERKAHARVRERLCDVVATELIMPELIFRKHLSNVGISINSVEHLANVFRVSIQAAAIRIAEVSVEPCVAILWQPQPRNESKLLKMAWSAGPGIRPLSKTHYMPVYDSIRYPSLLHKAYECQETIKGHKLFKCGVDVKRLPMESKGFGYGENRYVISLAFPNISNAK